MPASGTGAWEAALVNTLSPGDRVLMFETGHFATLWRAMAERLGLVVDFVPGDWRSGVDPARRRGEARRGPRARRSRPCSPSTTRRRPASRRASPPIRAGDRPRRPSGAVHGRHDQLARVDRLSSRRMGRRRHRRRLAEGTDAAAGAVVQRGQRQGARREQAREAAALVLALGRDDRDEPAGLLSVDAGDQPPLRPARGARDAARGRPAEGVRAPRSGTPKRRAAPSAHGDSRCCAAIRPNTADR